MFWRTRQHILTSANLIQLKFGTFADARETNPAQHIWTAMKRDWYTIPAGVPSYSQQPPLSSR